MDECVLKIEQLEKSFGDLHVLKGIDLEIHASSVHPAPASPPCSAASTFWKRPTTGISGLTGRI